MLWDFSQRFLILCVSLVVVGSSGAASATGGVDALPVITAKESVTNVMQDKIVAAKALSTLEEQLVELINNARQTHVDLNGVVLPPLKREMLLDDAARAHSQRMATQNFLGHCDPSNGTPSNRLSDVGYDHARAAESIVVGYQDAESVLNAMLSSAAIRAMLLSAEMWEIGVGFAHDEGDMPDISRDLDEDCDLDTTSNGPYYFYWTVLLGQRGHSSFPIVINRERVSTSSQSVDLFLYGQDWADEMKVWNEGETPPASWEDFEPDKPWVLTSGHGEKRVYAQVRCIYKKELLASDTIISYEGLSVIFEDGFESGHVVGWEIPSGTKGEEE